MIVTENKINFNSFEKNIYTACCAAGREMIKKQLENWDDELMLNRDRAIYRHKGKRKTVLKTIMGEVEYERAVYKQNSEDGTKKFVYLLDEVMNLPGSGYMSGLLSEMIAKAACESPYRDAARSISELTGQTISHTAAWNITQEIGERVDTQEQQATQSAAKYCGIGKIETPVLFEEQDGIWLKLQGKDRKAHGKGKEMKVAIAYDGAKKTGEKRYELTNKVACANFENTTKFQKRKEGLIADNYNVDEIEMRFLNGDGAGWIKNSTDDTVHFQLDTFHRNKAITTYVKNPEIREQITQLLYDKKIDMLLDYIEALSNSVIENEEEHENLLKLHTYFANNKEGLVPYYRRGLKIPEPPEGKEYRRMGAMESNVFTLIGNRMKGRRACWSINGGNNLARLLCLKMTGKLSDTLKTLTSAYLPEKYSQEVTTNFSAATIAKSTGIGYDGIKQSIVPSSMKWLKNIALAKPLLDI
jgi:dsDNA-binding SOS-regulon protein